MTTETTDTMASAVPDPRTVERLVHRFDHHDPEFTPDVAVEVHRGLRAAGRPVFSEAHGGMWVLATHEHVLSALRDHERFSSAQGVFFPRAADQPRFAPLEYDPPEHTAFRGLMRPATAASAVGRVAGRVAELAHEVVDPVIDRGGGDLVSEVTTVLPLSVLAETIGFSDAARAEILGLTRMTWSTMAGGSAEFWPRFAALLDAEIAAARRSSDDTFLAELVAAEVDGVPVTDEQLRVMLIAFAIAGHETTMNTGGHLLWRVARDPDLADRLRDDPDARPAAVDETLRMDTPVDHGSRVTTEPVEIAGVTIPPGERVILAVGAANRDPDAFDDPDAFRLDRGPTRHLSLGQGIHYCLGAQLGKTQLVALLDAVLAGPPVHLTGVVPRRYANGRHLNLDRLPVAFG